MARMSMRCAAARMQYRVTYEVMEGDIGLITEKTTCVTLLWQVQIAETIADRLVKLENHRVAVLSIECS